MNSSEKWLVTGAAGFIGGRLCEHLTLEAGVPVKALVRHSNTAGTARLARLPVEIVHGDLLRPETLEAAVQNCPVIVHLGLGAGRGISAGTRNILRAATRSSVRRFVHVSSVAVHGLKPPPEAETEDARLRAVGNVYGDEKIRAERIAKRYHAKGLPVTILRPGIVFGPFGQWTKIAMRRVTEDRPVLVDSGSGICNTTYVDNLVHAICLAAENPAAVGETFFVTDGERITWREYYRAYSAMLRRSVEFEDLASDDILKYWSTQPGLWASSARALRSMFLTGSSLKQFARVPLVQWMIDHVAFRLFTDFSKDRVKSVLRIPQFASGNRVGGVNMPDPATVAIETTAVRHSIRRIEDLLGYRPVFSFAEGIRRTEDWLATAGYLG